MNDKWSKIKASNCHQLYQMKFYKFGAKSIDLSQWIHSLWFERNFN